MMNFLDPILRPKVNCNRDCTDSYEAQNLISNNFMQKSRGFMAYPTIKPPVDIDFELICPIRMGYIVIKSSVGNHKCSGIEIFSLIEDNSYCSIGEAFYDEDGVVFFDRTVTREVLLPYEKQNYHLSPMKRTFLMHNSNSYKIRIKKTSKFVPCLGSVQIWGTVSRICSDITKNFIQKMYGKSKQKVSNSIPSDGACSSNCNDENSLKSVEIPEDYKDDLTLEIMTIPMTLPSGKTIDLSTLERHNVSEAVFGRKPSDPFTGLDFTESRKAVLNVALKSRIDMYLLQHSSEPQFFSLGRSVGHGSRRNQNDEEYSVSEVKKIKLDNDGDEISYDVSGLNFKQFSDGKADKCFTCSTNQMLFILPCKHLFCRTCVTEICEKNFKCGKCFKDFERANVERYHV